VTAVTLAAALIVLTGRAEPGAQRRAPGPSTRIATPAPGRASGTQIPSSRGRTRLEALLDAERRGLEYLPGEVLIKFRPGVNPAGRQRALSALRSRPAASTLEWTSGGLARHVDAVEPNAHVLAGQLARQPEVEYAQPNYIRRVPVRSSYAVRAEGTDTRAVSAAATATPQGVPNDPDFADLQWNFSLLNMPQAWDINAGGNSSTIVAIIDTGLTTADTTLQRTIWTGLRFETVTMPFAVSPDLSPSRVAFARDYAFEPGPVVLDFEGHGTHVASTIAQDTNNSQWLAGMAYNVRVMPIKVCLGFWELMIELGARAVPGYIPSSSGLCFTEDIAAGIRYAADNGAQVINVSIGGAEPSPAEQEAIAYAIDRGAFVATAVGNHFEQGNATHYPAGYAGGMQGLMAVGAIGKSQTRAYYSATGSYVEIVAPGGSDLDGGGEDDGYVWQVTLLPSDQNRLFSPRPRFDRYVEVGYEGTSMATPHVAAAAALLVSQGIRDPRAIEAVLKSTAKDLGAAGRDDQYGFGLVQPRTALFGLGIAR
jgi:serine protease